MPGAGWLLPILMGVMTCLTPLPGHAFELAVLAPKDGTVQEQFLSTLKSELGTSGVHLVPLEDAEDVALDVASLDAVEAIVALGSDSAAHALASSHRPVLAVMISQTGYQDMQARFPARQLGGIVLDQPQGRQLALIRAVLPQARNIGLLLGGEAPELEAAYAREAKKLGLQLQSARFSDVRGSVPVMEQLMAGSDCILIPPHPPVLTAANARIILLTTYRAGQPLFAFSSAAVDAGAMAAVFSSPSDVAREVAAWARAQRGSVINFPKQTTPKNFSIAVNRKVARSLGMNIVEDDVVLKSMHGAEP